MDYIMKDLERVKLNKVTFKRPLELSDLARGAYKSFLQQKYSAYFWVECEQWSHEELFKILAVKQGPELRCPGDKLENQMLCY